jgi:hypothetical protein
MCILRSKEEDSSSGALDKTIVTVLNAIWKNKMASGKKRDTRFFELVDRKKSTCPESLLNHATRFRTLAFVRSWLKQSVEFSKWIEKNTYRTIENLRLSAALRHLRYSLQWLRASPDYSRVTH